MRCLPQTFLKEVPPCSAAGKRASDCKTAGNNMTGRFIDGECVMAAVESRVVVMLSWCSIHCFEMKARGTFLVSANSTLR